MIVDLPLAPIAVLAFLCLVLFLVVMVAVTIVSRLQKKTALSALCLKILAGGAGFYFVAMLGVSAFSKDYDLRPGAEKHFCELDCHIANSVTKVERVTRVPADFANAPTPAPGQLFVVTLHTRFDETTIGPNRGDGLLTPNPRAITVRDDAGREYEPVVSFSDTPLDTALRPGQSYDTRLLFSIPADAKNPKLLLRTAMWPDAFLIGDERSLLHGKAYFDLKG